MSHEIENLNGRDSVFVVGEPAWHKLGQVLDKPATSEEAIQAANLDWSVEKTGIQTMDGMEIPEQYAIIRNVDRKPLGIVGEVYKPVQNREAFSFFDSVVGGGQAVYESAGSLRGGRVIWIMAKLTGSPITVVPDDVVDKYLLFVNSHDGSKAVQMFFNPTRVVCANTLRMAMSNMEHGISIRHSSSVNAKMDEARSVLGISLRYYEQIGDTMKMLASKKITQAIYRDYLKQVFPDNEDAKHSTRTDNIRIAVEERYNAPTNRIAGMEGSLWAAYNSVVEHCDFKSRSKSEIDQPERRLDSMWFGGAANYKDKAWDAALSLANV